MFAVILSVINRLIRYSLGIVMFDNLSSTWAVATLGFVSLGIVALVNVLYFFGPWLRARSKLARTF